MTDTSGLCYMRARYYNPEIRSFVNQNVLIGSIDDSQSLKRFAYVNGKPVNSVDPFGLFSFKNSFNRAKQAVNKGLNKAKQYTNKTVNQAKKYINTGADFLTKPSTLKTIKKVASVTGGVAAVAGLVVASPVIGAVAGVSLVASVVTTGVM